MLSVRHTFLVLLAVLVAAFVAFYPYLAGMEMCGVGECPYVARSYHEGSAGPAPCVSAVLAASSAAVLAFVAFRRHRVGTDASRPTEVYLSLDPPPPRLSPSL